MKYFAYLGVNTDIKENREVEDYLTTQLNNLIGLNIFPQIGWQINHEMDNYIIDEITFTEKRAYHKAYPEEDFPLIEFRFELNT